MRSIYEDSTFLMKLYTFNPDTGRLFHAVDKFAGNGCVVAKANAPADTSVGNHGYRAVSFTADGKERKLLAHRVLYTLARGCIPEGMVIDHINGKRSDNRLSNLRVVTKRMNDQNRTKARGCDWYKPRRLWRARITINGNEIALGLFSTEEEAHSAYLFAKARHLSEALLNQTGIL
ncbi:HNH endonuclease [Pantoea eucalypti]|uniref:HNH endonuclease n=1 Tax=Pantoea eucalypti TaxID=470933 RepID=UPI003EE51C20